MSAGNSADLSVAVGDGIALLEMRRPPANHVDELLIARLLDAMAGLETSRHAG